jgi:hypothetical protein
MVHSGAVSVLVLAVIAALVFAVGSVLQQRGAHASARLVLPHRRRKGLRLANLLLGSPTWLAGAGLALCGFGIHATALHAGSLAVVQPIQTLTLPASLLIAGARAHRIARVDWLGIASLCGGVAVFLVISAPHDGPPRSRGLLLLVALVVTGLVALFWIAGEKAIASTRGLLLGSAAALALGLTAALTKATTSDLADGGIGHALANWPLYGLVVAAVAGVGLEQAAFAGAPLATVMLPVTLLNPVAATLMGMLAWHERLSSGALAVLVGILAGLALAAVGTSVLSRSPLLQEPPARVR